MKKIFLYTILLLAISSCEKETSVEGDGSIKYADGTLLDSANNCQHIVVNGTYQKDDTLTGFNNIVVNVNFTQPGNYTIYTDTVNGYWFYIKGYAYSTGLQTIAVNGFGKINTNTNTHFAVRFNNSKCYFTVKKYTPVLNNGTSNDYFPTTNFSSWTYNNSIINDTTTLQVLGTDKNIVGNSYRQFLMQIPLLSIKDTVHFRKDMAGNYYTYDTIGAGAKTEYQFLKDYASVGNTWESPTVAATYQSTPTTVKYVFTLKRKNVKRTIGTNTIDSIIIVQAETQYLISGNYTTTNTVEYSYAKSVGLVNVQQTGATNNYALPIKTWVIN
jgi:hypothetical protein